MPQIFKKHYSLRDLIFCAGEGLLIFLAFCTVQYLLLGDYLYFYFFSTHITQGLLITFVFQLCLYFYDLYDLSLDVTLTDTATRMTQAFGLGCIVLGLIYYSLPLLTTAIRIFWPAYFTICGVILLWRWAYYAVLKKRIFVQKILLIGTGKFASTIAKEIEGRHDSAYKIVSFTGEGEVEYNPYGVPVYDNIPDMVEYCQTQNIKTIVLALDDRRKKTPSRKLLVCKLNGISVQPGTTFYESITGKLPVERVDPSGIFFSDGFNIGRWTKGTKRVLDILLSLFVLIVSLPITLLSAIIIKLETPGSVFYLQERVGERGKFFKVINFGLIE